MRFTDKSVRSLTNPGRYTETGSSGLHLYIKKKVSGVYKRKPTRLKTKTKGAVRPTLTGTKAKNV